MVKTRRRIHGLPGVKVVATRTAMNIHQDRSTEEQVDLLHCTGPGLQPCWIKVTFLRGDLTEWDLYFSEQEARACWEFPPGCSDLAGLAVPDLLLG